MSDHTFTPGWLHEIAYGNPRQAECLTAAADEIERLTAERDALVKRWDEQRALLVQWVFVFDGHTEPLHPLSWQTELEATKRALGKETP